MILFISRKYPPAVGGMEKLSYELINSVLKKRNGKKVVWGGSQKWLPFVYFYLFYKSFYFCMTNQVKVIHLGDPILSPLGIFLRLFFKKPLAVTVHGLDITYENSFYQWFIPKCLKKVDVLISISDQTKKEIIERGINENKIIVITPGFLHKNIPEIDKEKDFTPLFELTNNTFENKIILLTVGRLVRRKGVLFFISEVISRIKEKDKFIYLICGDGPDREKIREVIIKNKMENQVILLGKVSEGVLDLVYRKSDIFIMPNIAVKGDMEGFGLVALEACLYALPVIASNMEGIKNAIFDKINGFLVEPGDYQNYMEIINNLAEDKDRRKEFGLKAREYTIDNYNWDVISEKYIKCFDSLN